MISASKINSYIHCPKQYFFQYVEKIEVGIKSPWLELGSKVHGMIAKGEWQSDDTMIRLMLRNARKFLNNMPSNPIMETTYEDKNNPGRFFGDIFGRRSIGIFDYHWSDYPLAGDWKTGKLDERFTDSLEVQGYILGELYRQKYDVPLSQMYFNFIKFGKVYKAESIKPGATRNKIEHDIESALSLIDDEIFPKKVGRLCDYCDYREYCNQE